MKKTIQVTEEKVETEKYKIINELSYGSYFGEISLLTNLRRTCSIISVSVSVCGAINKTQL
jgi:CRP-like cAMP-binding protein